MHSPADTRVYRLSGVCAFLAASSFVAPRFVANPEGGFAAGASAVLTLLIMLGISLLFSLYLLSVTVRRYGSLSSPAKAAGIGPCLVLSVALLGLVGFLRF